MNQNDIYFYYSIGIIFYIVLSDILDGYLARRNNEVTNLGKVIDPVADKVCLLSVLIFLIDVYKIPFLIFFIFLSIRDIVLFTFSLYFIIYKDYTPQANNSGKFFLLITTIMLILYIYNINNYLSQILYLVSLLLLIVSMILYLKSHIRNLKS